MMINEMGPFFTSVRKENGILSSKTMAVELSWKIVDAT